MRNIGLHILFKLTLASVLHVTVHSMCIFWTKNTNSRVIFLDVLMSNLCVAVVRVKLQSLINCRPNIGCVA